jgi:hypothetical protein
MTFEVVSLPEIRSDAVESKNHEQSRATEFRTTSRLFRLP